MANSVIVLLVSIFLLCFGARFCACDLSERIGPFPHRQTYTPLTEISNQCLAPLYNNLTSSCVIFQLNDPSSPVDINISCLKPGVLRVRGEFRILKFRCKASYAIDLYYYGILPTEAILVDWEKGMDNSSFVSQSGERVFVPTPSPEDQAKYFQMEFFIYSVNELFSFFTGAAPRNGKNVTKKDYTRTGSYVIGGIFNKTADTTRRMPIFLYLEDSATPSLLSNEKTYIQVTAEQNDAGQKFLSIPCIPSHFNATIELKSSNPIIQSTMALTSENKHQGFMINLDNTVEVEKYYGDYTCQMMVNGELVDTRTLTFSSSSIPNNTVTPYGLNRPISEQHKNLIGFTSDLDTERYINVKIKCHVENYFDEQHFLANIEIQNFGQMKLVQPFVLPKFINQSYMAEKFDPAVGDALLREHYIKKVFHLRSGTTFCSSGNSFEYTDYGASLPGFVYKFQFGKEWADFPRENSSIITHMELHIVDPPPPSPVYANTSVTFKCKANIVVIFKPMVWFFLWKNGSFSQELIDYDWKQEHSFFTTKLDPDVQEIYCFASYWYSTFWRNVSQSLDLLVGSPPSFAAFAHIKEVTSHKIGDPLTINCRADGQPTPKHTIQKDGVHGVILAESSQIIGATYSISIYAANMSGDYKCIAENDFGREERTFKLLTDEETGANYIVSILIPVVVFVVTVVGAIVYIKYFRKERLGLTQQEIDEFLKGEINRITNVENEYAHEFAHLTPYNDKYEIPTSKYQVDQTHVLGSGAYGTVLKGIVEGEPVAVKTIKKNAEKSYLKALLSELKIMIYLGNHDNIIQIVGAHTTELSKGIVYVFVKYCSMGNLEKFLRNNRSHYSTFDEYQNMSVAARLNSNYFNFNDLFCWSCQIANGMDYLASRKVIHGDLALRNVLLDDARQVKITDFGLSRQLYDYASYVKKQQEPLPWRWMALESLRDLTFSTYSDVWSYGITLWEIFSLGEIPYPGLSWTLRFVEELENGLRMGRPKQATEFIYLGIIATCWHERPEDRPSFKTIIERFESILNTTDPKEQRKTWAPFQSPNAREPSSLVEYMNTQLNAEPSEDVVVDMEKIAHDEAYI